jgi:hypothetical protein
MKNKWVLSQLMTSRVSAASHASLHQILYLDTEDKGFVGEPEGEAQLALRGDERLAGLGGRRMVTLGVLQAWRETDLCFSTAGNDL